MRFIITAAFTLVFASIVFPQAFTFEGSNLILQVPEDHRNATCAIRYAPPTRQITVKDLDSKTPFRVTACGGSGTRLMSKSGNSATFRAGGGNQWCFNGEDKNYEISFQGDRYSGPVKYIWSATLSDQSDGRYNVKDFGAKGDGATDDTVAIHSALAYVASRNGGILRFPEGDYRVGGVPGFDGLALPSGVTLEGVSGLQTGASTNNVKQKSPTRLTLTKSNSALFKIGECTEAVSIRDIELFATTSNKTIGIKGTGAYTSAQGFQFERMTFSRFWRGIQVEGLPQTNLNWQFDYIKIKDSRFIFNTDAGLYCNTRNSDWKIEGALFINPKAGPNQNAISMHFERVGLVLVEDTFGGGFVGREGGPFINMLDNGSLTVIGSQAEAVTHSMVYNGVNNPYAGDYSYPITLINNIFIPPIEFKARRTFVSTGSLYGPETFKAGPDLRVYSTGDRFCYDSATLKCIGGRKNNFDRATVVFMTGQPNEPNVPGHPTYFGTEVEFGKAVQMPKFRFSALPRANSDGSMIYCEDCRRDTTPCRGGGSGAPAMVVNGRWSCL